jgi:antitoxin ParD1/3/4
MAVFYLLPKHLKRFPLESQAFENFSVTLPREIARVIHERVNSGHYGSASEVIRDAMRAWMQRERRLAALDAALARGISELDAGRGRDAELVRQELRRASEPR